MDGVDQGSGQVVVAEPGPVAQPKHAGTTQDTGLPEFQRLADPRALAFCPARRTPGSARV